MAMDESQMLTSAVIQDFSSAKKIEGYPERDFRCSHVYRIGLHLFKTSDFRCRRRILIAAPREASSIQMKQESKDFSWQNKANIITDNYDEDDDDFLFPGKKRYATFLSKRKAMRKDLEDIGDTKKWLLSKERSPLEEQQLRRLLDYKEPYTQQVTTQRGASHSAALESPGLLDRRGSRCWNLQHRQIGSFKYHKDAWMEQARKEFKEFEEYCKRNEINVDMELAKNALLPPSDDPKCGSDLKCLLCPHTVFSEMASEEKRRLFGGQHEHSEPKRKPRRPKPEKVMLSTGPCELKVLVDTWLNFKLYSHMTSVHHRSHTSPEKFWPGEGLHLRRIPEVGPPKANSGTAIFYPVACNAKSTNVQVMSWPENEAGHVQIGSSSNKCYHL